MARSFRLRSVLWEAACWLFVLVYGGLPGRAETPSSVEGIYSGTIGREAVVLELEGVAKSEHGENYGDPSDHRTYPINGFYFYRRHGVSIELVGTPMSDGSLRLREYRQVVEYEFTAEWRITIRDDTAEGTFCKCDLSKTSDSGKPRLPIRLKRLSHALPEDTWEEYKPHAGDIYYDLLLDFPLDQGPEIEVNREIAYRMWTDTRFGVGRPKLTRFPDARVMARINIDLFAEFTQSRLWTAGCLSAGQHTGAFGGSYDETASVVAFPPDILSVVVERSWYCGAVHGDASAYGLNYNLHTGRRFSLDHSFQTATGSTGERELATLFAKLYKRHYVKPTGPVAPQDCDVILRRITSDDKQLIDSFSPGNATFFMVREGLVIIPTFLYADSGCGPDVTIPYGELRPFVKKDSMLRLLVDSQPN